MTDIAYEIKKINYLSINNCHLVVPNIPLNLFKNYKEEEIKSKLNLILETIHLLKDKINSKMLIDLLFEKENELPQEVSFYQYFLLVFYSFVNIIYTHYQFVLIRFPQLFPIETKETNFDFSLQLNLSNKEINIKEKKFVFINLRFDLLDIFEKIIVQIDESYLLKNCKLFQYNFTCLAGTFDRCHRGHYFFIQTSLMASKKQCFTGVCSDEMIKHKGPFSLIQTNYVRKKKLEEVVETNGHNSENCKYNISTIYDGVDMAGVQEDLDCLIVTSETYKGGLYCNEVRKKNNIKPVELLTVNVIKINLNEENKISSSIIRKEILDNICIEKINKICNDFKKLCKDIQCEDDNLVSYWWHEILNHYTKKWKFYHNLNHIYSFIELYEKYNNLIQKEKNEFLISIFFHDIIYIPSRNDNEKESIRIFNEFYKEVKPKNLNEKKVNELIIETENHLLNKDYEDDTNLFLDMDMQIVAQENWEDYENKIRKEYCFVDLNTYNIKRKEFLEGLEKKEKIFRTKTFYDEYEKVARSNIRKIIEKLSK